MALQRAVYRDAEHTVLHQVIAEHLEVFLRAVAETGDGAGLPQFVEREFREFLLCGVFEAGVARFQCAGCAREHFVPFSCKGRRWCPSCGGRRMTERAAHLVDAVLPWVPVRQWVLTVPYRLRYQMAWNHELSRAVLRVYTRVLLDVYARGARECGVPGGRTGSVTVMPRAGSGLNVNLHFHTLVLDGVFYAPNVRCDSGASAGRRPSLGGYVTSTGPRRGGPPPEGGDVAYPHLVQLGALGARSASKLSGGQQQRVALARAFVFSPAVLLFDEPLSNLDAKLRAEMRLEIKSFSGGSGSPRST